MTLPLSPCARAALRALIFTAAETLHDGTFYLHGSTRRSRAVVGAQTVFHELAIASNNGLLENPARAEELFKRVDRVLGQLARMDIDPVSLMVRRDYASERDRRRVRASRRRPPLKLRPQPRLVINDEQDGHR